MPIRLSGLSSGMDTESLVKALVSGYNLQKDNLVKARTKLEWKQDSWKTMNTSIYNFYKGRLSAARMSKTYNLKKASISNSNVAKVSAASNAVTGSQTLKVTNLAAMGYLTGGQISAKPDENGSTKITGSTKLSDIKDMVVGGSFSVEVDGKRTDVVIDTDTTVNQFIARLKDAGLSANFDEGNQRFFVSAAKSGKDHDFSLTANDAGGLKALQKLGLHTATDVDGDGKLDEVEYQKWANLDLDSTEKQKLIDAEREKHTTTYEIKAQAEANKYNAAKAVLKAFDENDTWGSLEAAEDKLTQDKTEFDAKFGKYYNATDKIYDIGSMSETERKEYEVLDKQIKAQENNIKVYKDNQKYMSEAAAYVTVDSNGNAVADPENAEVKKAVDETNDIAEVNAINLINQKVAFAKAYVNGGSVTYGYINRADDGTRTTETKTEPESAIDKTFSEGAVRIKGDDATIELNGAKFTSNTNNFSVNGLTIQVTEKTDKEVTITTEADIDAVYNNIKEFFKEYNVLITAMDTAYNADSSKGYEPLTSEEKEAMTDDDIEKWEKKIKDSLLRKDSTLGGAASAMKTLMNSAIEINGKKYSLASFGIKTQGYFESGKNEKGVYHIDGDPDDTVSAGNDDKLKAMLANDPDVVIEFFSKLTTKVYDDLGKKMNSTKLSSMYTLYNDKQMASEYSSYNTKISDKEDYIARQEDYYYKKFSAMETALSKLNQTQTSLSGFFS